MNSRERVLTAIHHAEPDRVPMDFHGNAGVLERLHRDLGTTTHRDLLTRLRSDMVDLRGTVDPIYRGPVPLSRDLGEGVRENFWGWRQRAVQTDTGVEECFVNCVLSGATSIEEFDRMFAAAPGKVDILQTDVLTGNILAMSETGIAFKRKSVVALESRTSLSLSTFP